MVEASTRVDSDRTKPFSGARDLRIDFFRGAALFMILFDHVGDDPLSKFTYGHFGFSDAAEIFVFLSGVSCGIVYFRILKRFGWAGLLSATIRRAAYIYSAYLVTSVLIVALIAGTGGLTHFDAFNPGDQPYITLQNAPWHELFSSVLLTSLPVLPGILTLYIVLALFAIPLVFATADVRVWLPLLISMMIWLISQIDPAISPHLSIFALFAWQFLFTIGMYVGITRYSNERAPSQRQRPIVIWCAWAIAAGSLFYKIAKFASLKLHTAESWFASNEQLFNMKGNLSAVRLLHFLAVASLVAHYVSDRSPFFKRRAAVALVQTGRNSLEMFCLSAVLSVLLNMLVATYHPNLAGKLLADLCAIFVMVWAARELTRFRDGEVPLRQANAHHATAGEPQQDVRSG